jgi:hypothetical protein
MQLKEKDMRNLLMIGEIKVSLPFAQEEAENYVVDATTIGEQSAVTVREDELEQMVETTQAEVEKETEHSEEWLNMFS